MGFEWAVFKSLEASVGWEVLFKVWLRRAQQAGTEVQVSNFCWSWNICWHQGSASWLTTTDLAKHRPFQNNLSGLSHSNTFSLSSEASASPSYSTEENQKKTEIDRNALGRRRYEWWWGLSGGRTIADKSLEVQITLTNMCKTNQDLKRQWQTPSPRACLPATPREPALQRSHWFSPGAAAPGHPHFPFLPTASPLLRKLWGPCCACRTQQQLRSQGSKEEGRVGDSFRLILTLRAALVAKTSHQVNLGQSCRAYAFTASQDWTREEDEATNNTGAITMHFMGPLGQRRLPRWLSGKESACQCRRCRSLRFDPWIRKIPWRRKWQPTPYSCLENPVDRGAWWTRVHGVAKSQMQLTQNAQTDQNLAGQICSAQVEGLGARELTEVWAWLKSLLGMITTRWDSWKPRNLQDAMKQVCKDVVVTYGDRLEKTSDQEKTHLCGLRHLACGLCDACLWKQIQQLIFNILLRET